MEHQDLATDATAAVPSAAETTTDLDAGLVANAAPESSASSSAIAAGAGAASDASSSSSAVPGVVGTLVMAGSVAHSLTGRSAKPAGFDGVEEQNLWIHHTISTLADVKMKRVITGPQACHYMAISEDGSLYVWGRNERGQLGLGNTLNKYVPTKVTTLPGPVLTGHCGRTHSLIVLESGDIYGAGENSKAQCSNGRTDDTLLKWTRAVGVPSGTAVSVACGLDFSLALDSQGKVYSCGSQQYGQCGTGATGEWIVTAGKVAFQEIISFKPIPALAGIPCTQIAAGANHGVALAKDGTVYTWGFGGFGRLGHGDPKDALVPKQIAAFAPDRMRVKFIAAGNAATFCITHMGDSLFYCGILKKSGEANMKPNYVPDLGVKTKLVASGATSTILSADDSGIPCMVAFGPSPTCGELGFGDVQKSSTKPKYVDLLDGTHAIDLSMGLGGSLVLLDTTSDTEAAKKAQELIATGKIPTYTPVEPAPMPPSAKRAEPGPGSAAVGKKPAGRPAKKGKIA